MIERYPLKTIEKKWRAHWGLETPLSLLENSNPSHLGESRILVYKDIAQRRKQNPKNLAVAPLLFETYQDENGNWISLDEALDDNLLKKNKPVPMSIEKKNAIPLPLVTTAYGIDATRLFLVSDNPYNIPLHYNEDTIEGAWRFVNAFWQKSSEILATPSSQKHIHKEMTLEVEVLFDADETHKALAKCREVFKLVKTREDLDLICDLFSPVTPHITSEIKQRLSQE